MSCWTTLGRLASSAEVLPVPVRDLLGADQVPLEADDGLRRAHQAVKHPVGHLRLAHRHRSCKGALTAALKFNVAGISKGAREAIEKAGGSVELIIPRNPGELAAAKKGKTLAARKAGKGASAKGSSKAEGE